jgi:acetamidase/formamidase
MTPPHLTASPATTLWGRLPSEADAPVLSVEAGTQVIIDTVSHEGILEDQGRDPVAFFGRHGVAAADVLADAIDIAAKADHRPGDGPHVVTGPIAVRGARPGDWLAVRVDALARRADYGVISSRHGRGALPGRFPAGGALVTSVFCRVDDTHGYLPLRSAAADRGADDRPGVRFPLAPFLGIMGVTPRGAVRRGSIAPGEFGGNLDISLLVPGSVLYLPVEVHGAGFYVGDPHYAQGNGEIALTALEAPLTATLTLGLVEAAAGKARFGEVAGPVVTTPQYLVPTGLDADLDIAVERCAANAVELLRASFGMDPGLGYAYLSAAADFDISQVVDLVKGVHARIRRADFPGSGGWPW